MSKQGSWKALVLSVAAVPLAVAAEKPRVFITESHALIAAANTNAAGGQSALAIDGGNSPQNVEVIRAFSSRCPGVVVTSSREKADFVVRFDHEELSPVTPFTHGNKVAVFNHNDDLIYSNASRLIGPSIKGACAAVTATAR